ncbi:hypothetical protein WJR50_28655 [Catalinimonas sp. 4WD22]
MRKQEDRSWKSEVGSRKLSSVSRLPTPVFHLPSSNFPTSLFFSL